MRSECIGGLSRLLSTALQCREEFKRSSCFSSVFQRLLDRVVSAGGEIEDDDIGEEGTCIPEYVYIQDSQ